MNASNVDWSAVKADFPVINRQINGRRLVYLDSANSSQKPNAVIDAMGDGTGAIMLDGKMEDDASVKQCKVVVELARQLAARDPELAASYGF